MQLRENLFGAQHTFRFALMVDFIKLRRVSAILASKMALAAPSIEASVEHTLFRVECGCLFQHRYTQVIAIDDVAAVVTLLARQNGKQRGFARAVFGNQSYALSFAYGEGDVVEED